MQGNAWLSEGKGSLPVHVEFISLCDYYAESYEYITLRKTSDFIRIFFLYLSCKGLLHEEVHEY